MLRKPVVVLLIILAILTVVRFILGARLDLSPDEAYYYAWSLTPASGYYDHPPMVAYLIHASVMFFGKSELAVRLPAILSGLLAPLIVYYTALEAGATAGLSLAAALTLVLTPLASAGSLIITPDSPLMLFWSAAMLLFVRLAVRSGSMTTLEKASTAATAGVFLGLAMLSKYTAVILATAPFLYIAFSERKKSDILYLAAIPFAAGFVVFLPNLLYNLGSSFKSVGFQLNHVFPWKEGDEFRYLPEFIGGQIGVAGPFLFAGVLWIARRFFSAGVEPGPRILQMATLLLFGVSLTAAVFGKVEANWPAMVYVSAAPLLAAMFSAPSGISKRAKRLIISSIVYGLLATLIIHVHAFTPFIPIPIGKDPVLQQLTGWKESTSKLANIIESVPDSGKKLPVTFSYRLSSELFYYEGDRIQSLCMDRRFLPEGGDIPMNGAERWIAIEQYPAKKSEAVMKTICKKGYENNGVVIGLGDQVLRRIDVHWCK